MKVSDYVYIISDLLIIFSLHMFGKRMFPDTQRSYIRAITLAIYWIVDCVLYINISQTGFMALTSIMMFFLVSVLYGGGIKIRCFIITVVTFVYSVCSELLAAYIVSVPTSNINNLDANYALCVALLISRLLFFVFIFVTIRFIKTKDKREAISNSIALLIIPVFSIFLVLYIFSLAEFEKNEIRDVGSLGAMLSVTLIVWINIVVFWLFDRLYRMYKMEQETKSMQQTILAQQKYYDSEIKIREGIRKTIHDQKNLFLAIKTDLEANNIEKVRETIDKQLGAETINNISQSGFYPLDAIVGYKYALADEKGISIELSYKMVGLPDIENADICVMIGNALDNAIEYLEKHSIVDQCIKLKVVYDKGTFVVSIKNEVEHNIAIRNNSDISTTKNDENHGYGLKSMKYIAEKYGGELYLSSENNMFECKILMHC